VFRSQRSGLKGRLGVRALQGIVGTVVLMEDIFVSVCVTQSGSVQLLPVNTKAQRLLQRFESYGGREAFHLNSFLFLMHFSSLHAFKNDLCIVHFL